MSTTGASVDGFGALQQILRKRPSPAAGERCDYCSVPVGPNHSHLIDLQARRILCSCRPCFLVFEPRGAAQGRYKPIPARYARIDASALAAERWDALAIPIGLAFFFFNSIEEKTVAFYPGPAGATESLLPLEAWQAIESLDPALAAIEADVEAVLIDRRGPRTLAYIVPIDAAYELVGLIRASWRGFDGGDETHRRIAEFFARVDERCDRRTTARIDA
jgi:hypothetical protein